MSKYSSEDLNRLIEETRVHRSVYLDPEIFDLEMERVFTRAWVYVGHESQVKKPGDYFCTWIGRQPVILSRHTDGQIYVLFNRCAHRGARVLNEEKGNAKQFRCCYHGWSYFPDGELAGVPLAEGYGEDFDLSDPAMGMARVPRVDSYRGFVFASLSPDGPDLKTHLGQATLAFDELNDLAPDGEVELAAGVHRYTIRGNWKFQAENNCDMYHAPYAHASSLGRDNRQFQRFEGDRGVSFSDRDGSALPLWDEAGLWVTGLGHVIQGPLPRTGEANSPADTRYRAMLEEKHGLERARELMSPRRLATLIYPNVLIHSWNRHVRVFVPHSVDRTEVRVYPIHLKGIPEELFQREIRHLNVTHAAASFIQPDDVETFGRQQVGLTADSADWVRFTRGSGADLVDSEMGWRTFGTNEVGMRHQHEAWRSYMCTPPGESWYTGISPPH